MFLSLISSGLLAGLAGTILAAQLGAATYDIGPAYLFNGVALIVAVALAVRSRRNA